MILNVGAWLITINCMGVFTELDELKTGNQDITKNFLRTKKFRKCLWGPIYKKKDPEFQAYELYIDYNGFGSAELYYFPPTFKGYVTHLNSRGVNPAGKCIGWMNNSSSWMLESDATCKFDINCCIKMINEKLKDYYGEVWTVDY